MQPAIPHSALRTAAGFLLLTSAQITHAHYGEQALRGNMLPDPYFRTEDGRLNKRGADAPVNRYRLYDFYRRQADHFLSLSGDQPALLPPFPGLDGGRRGHWGATNEKDTTALVRKTHPPFTTVTARNRTVDLYIRMAPGTDGPLLVYDSLRGGLRSVFTSATMSVPEHAFAKGVDRFGFSLAVSGTPAWAGDPAREWIVEGKPALEPEGYAIHGERTVLRITLAGIPVLELPSLLQHQDKRQWLLLRQFEFPTGVNRPLELQLPACPDLPAHSTAGDGRVLRTGGTLAAFLQIQPSDGLTGELDAGSGRVRIHAAPAGGRLLCVCWRGAIKALPRAQDAWIADSTRAALAVRPAALLQGGPPRLGPAIAVQGTLNADPEASGTAYEIDDVPVPGEEATPSPMTLSGLTFDEKGTAYLSTLTGDLWKVTGLTGDLREVHWKRYATGINLPLGLQAHGGAVFVSGTPWIYRLTDHNNDGEADTFERFNRQPVPGNPDSGRDLRRAADGSFYTHSTAGIWRISPDGARTENTGSGARNPLGLGLRADGLVISDSSEGDSENGTCTLYESSHPETAGTSAKRQRLLYLPRGVDNSPGSRVFLNDPRFGPLGQSIAGLSYGTGTWYYLVREVVEGTPQAALVPMPGQFLSGTARLAAQPLDGQLLAAGMDGWGDCAIAEGSLHRIRFTGKAHPVLEGWHAFTNGLRLEFSAPLSAAPAPSAVFVQQWNYIDSQHTYGSMEMSVRHPDKPGHDRLTPSAVTLSADRKSLFITVPGILPAMCTQLRAHLKNADGSPFPLDVYLSLQRLEGGLPGATPSPAGHPVVLTVPAIAGNGDTYQKTVEHFDKLAGRESVARPVSPPLEWKPEQLTYEWLKQHLFTASCIVCHAPGTPHDYSTYQGLMTKVRLDAPERSPLLGMMQTGTMPPYPLPTISPSAQSAVLAWIRRGAPEK